MAASNTQITSRVGQLKLLQRCRPPPPSLVLKEENSSQPDPTSRTPDCGFCQKRLFRNPLLCDACQVWNHATHVFQCLRSPEDFAETYSFSLSDILSRTNCVMCKMVVDSTLEKFLVLDRSNYDTLLKTEITMYGPYCLGEGPLKLLDRPFFEQHGEYKIEEDDLRLEDAEADNRSDILDSGNETVTMVLYVIATTADGHDLPEQNTPDPPLAADLGASKSTQKQPEKPFIALVSEPAGIAGRKPPSIGLQLELHYGPSMSTLLQVKRWEKSYFDRSLISSWINKCEDQHEDCKSTKSPRLPPHFRVIDVHRKCVVDLPSLNCPRFVALSYTWSSLSDCPDIQLEQKNLQHLEKVGSLEGPKIPALVHDVMRLCREAGERYVWIDKFCIVQDDAVSKHSQIQAMDQIYAAAAFTIVVALRNPPQAGLSGIIGRPRRSSLWNNVRYFSDKCRMVYTSFHLTVLHSTWNTRGWTYQEHLLSTRCIYITDFQIYFNCKTTTQQEELGSISVMPKLSRYNMTDYHLTVHEYTGKSLSFESDILNAFAGIGNTIAEWQGTKLIYGLPERYFSRALLWQSTGFAHRRKSCPEIPSWSWAAWTGRSMYNKGAHLDNAKLGTLVQFYYHNPKHGLRKLDEEEFWFFKSICLGTLTELPVITNPWSEMRSAPESAVTSNIWRNCPHNPWEVFSHPLDQVIVAKACKYPDALVFTTTSAKLSLRLATWPVWPAGSNSAILELYNCNGAKVGELMQLDQFWINKYLDMTQEHEFVVIAGAVLADYPRHALQKLGLGITGVEVGDDRSPWCLSVMLITPANADGIAQRLAVGFILTHCWKQCEPVWRTVALI